MEHILACGLLVAFIFLFKGVYASFSTEKRHSAAREVVDQQLAAAFIGIAIEIYKERNQRPDLAQAMRMQQLIERQDDLVEEYHNQIEQKSRESQVIQRMLHVVK